MTESTIPERDKQVKMPVMRLHQLKEAERPPIEHADDSNDEVANSRNLDALRKEMERDNPRKEFVLSLMRQTFTTRQEDILADTNASVSTILEKQSALSLPFAVSDKV